jgi:hypothetical protein
MWDRLKRDGWVPYAKAYGTAAVAAVVLAVSAVRLVVLGEQVGTPAELRWTLPVALDVGGVVATVVWTKSTGTAAKWGAVIALLSLAESLAGNILSDLIDARLLPVTPVLVIGVGAVYPITLFLMIHLLVVSSGSKRQPRHAARPEPKRAEAVREPAKAEEPTPAPAAAERKQLEPVKPTVVDITDVLPKREQGRRYVLAQRAAGRPAEDISAAEVDRVIGANSYSKKFIKDWLTEPLDTTGTAAAGN